MSNLLFGVSCHLQTNGILTDTREKGVEKNKQAPLWNSTGCLEDKSNLALLDYH